MSKLPPPVKVVTLRASLFSAVPGDRDIAVECDRAWDPFKDPPSAAALEGDRLGRGAVRKAEPEQYEPDGVAEHELSPAAAADRACIPAYRPRMGRQRRASSVRIRDPGLPRGRKRTW